MGACGGKLYSNIIISDCCAVFLSSQRATNAVSCWLLLYSLSLVFKSWFVYIVYGIIIFIRHLPTLFYYPFRRICTI